MRKAGPLVFGLPVFTYMRMDFKEAFVVVEDTAALETGEAFILKGSWGCAEGLFRRARGPMGAFRGGDNGAVDRGDVRVLGKRGPMGAFGGGGREAMD